MTGAPVDRLGPLLVSLQLSDTAFPSGFYTLSHGLEGFVQAGLVDRPGVPALLADLLRHGVGPAAATALALAHRAATANDWPGVSQVDRRLYASTLNRGLRQASVRAGRQALDTVVATFGGPWLPYYAGLVAARRTPGCQAVVAAVTYATAGVPTDQAVAGDLFAVTASFVGAALRLRLTDHRGAQVLLRGAAGVIEEVTDAALRADLADLGGCVPMADVMSGRHERAEARMFAT